MIDNDGPLLRCRFDNPSRHLRNPQSLTPDIRNAPTTNIPVTLSHLSSHDSIPPVPTRSLRISELANESQNLVAEDDGRVTRAMTKVRRPERRMSNAVWRVKSRMSGIDSRWSPTSPRIAERIAERLTRRSSDSIQAQTSRESLNWPSTSSSNSDAATRPDVQESS